MTEMSESSDKDLKAFIINSFKSQLQTHFSQMKNYKVSIKW